jgi:hypothetical protein
MRFLDDEFCHAYSNLLVSRLVQPEQPKSESSLVGEIQ